MSTYRIYVCHNDSCKRAGAQAVWKALQRELQTHDANGQAEMIVSGCQARCDFGPNLTIHPGGTKYSGVAAEDTQAIVKRHLLGGQIVEELVSRWW